MGGGTGMHEVPSRTSSSSSRPHLLPAVPMEPGHMAASQLKLLVQEQQGVQIRQALLLQSPPPPSSLLSLSPC
jgi:hypothetical protein